jgi:hypothetical protein
MSSWPSSECRRDAVGVGDAYNVWCVWEDGSSLVGVHEQLAQLRVQVHCGTGRSSSASSSPLLFVCPADCRMCVHSACRLSFNIFVVEAAERVLTVSQWVIMCFPACNVLPRRRHRAVSVCLLLLVRRLSPSKPLHACSQS